MKATKQAARYTPQGTKQEHCGICEHFEAPSSCERVAGLVTSGGWCRFFLKRDSVRRELRKAAE